VTVSFIGGVPGENHKQMVLGGILFLNDKKKTGILRMKFINIRNSTFQPYLCGCRVQFDWRCTTARFGLVDGA
jgi:hypothetical protein